MFRLDAEPTCARVTSMTEPCPDDFMLTPVVRSRNCGTPASQTSGCPDADYPVVVVQAAVPEVDSTVTLSVKPTVAFTPGMWVMAATGQGQVPFAARVVSVTATELVVRNAMRNGDTILNNPPPGTIIAQCGAVAIVSEPSNVSTNPDTRCVPDMSTPVEGQIVGLQGLTRAESVAESGKCDRYIHDVGANTKTLWVKAMTGVTPDGLGLRYVVWDTETGLIKKVNKTSSSNGFMRIGAGGAVSFTDDINGASVTEVPVGGLPVGTNVMFYDPITKAFYRIPPTNGKTLVGEDGTWKLKDHLVGTVILDTPIKIAGVLDGTHFGAGADTFLSTSGAPSGAYNVKTLYPKARVAILRARAGVTSPAGTSATATVTCSNRPQVHVSFGNNGDAITDRDSLEFSLNLNSAGAIDYDIATSAAATATAFGYLLLIGYIE